MCSICKSILRNLVLPHDVENCTLKKSLLCEFCSSRGHTQWTCPNRLRREKQLHVATPTPSYKHPEEWKGKDGKQGLYDESVWIMPKTDKVRKALLKSLGESYATDPERTKERLRKKLTSLKYKVIE